MQLIERFKHHLAQYDLGLVFEIDNGRDRVVTALQSTGVFEPYRHLLEAEESWVKGAWDRCSGYGYAYAIGAESHARTPLDCDRMLTSLKDDPASRDPFVSLYSSRGWNVGRGGFGIKSVLKAENWDNFDGPQYRINLNAAINEIAAFNPDTESCGAFFQRMVRQNEWRELPDITILFHMIWPQFYPVWYRSTVDGYSQVPGMAKLLDAMSDKIEIERKSVDLETDYSSYSAAYRVILLAYHSFIYEDPRHPLDTPHFDFFTQFLAELDAQAVAAKMLLLRKALVIYGVPGTGKTHAALKEIGPAVAEKQNIHRIQFHPGYSYSDFVIGIRPQSSGAAVTYPVIPGVLYRIAAEAALAWDNYQASCNLQAGALGDGTAQEAERAYRYVLIIDEINRADLAKVLGEAMFALEYRGSQDGVVSLPHQASGGELESVFVDRPRMPRDPFAGGSGFYIPVNLYIIGTMNHVDRSISGFDSALRRRFAWAQHSFSAQALRRVLDDRFKARGIEVGNTEAYIKRCRSINELIAPEDDAIDWPFNSDHILGHTYFADIDGILGLRRGLGKETNIMPADLETLWLYHLRPLLEDYLGFEVHSYRDSLKKLRDHFIARLS